MSWFFLTHLLSSVELDYQRSYLKTPPPQWPHWGGGWFWNVWHGSGHLWWNTGGEEGERSEEPPLSSHHQKYMPHHTWVILTLRSVWNISLHSYRSVWQSCSWMSPSPSLTAEVGRWGERERGWGIHMTLELVDLLGHGLLGGTALAAAGFFPLGCIRLMHVLGFGSAVVVRGFCSICSWSKECLWTGLHIISNFCKMGQMWWD